MAFDPVDTGIPELNRLINTDLAMADEGPDEWLWLSFADPLAPEGSQWLGCAIVTAPNLPMAAMEARRRGCNPGGEIAAWPLPKEPPAELTWRLITDRAEAEAIDPADWP